MCNEWVPVHVARSLWFIGQPPELARLIQERDELMRTGNYAADDKLVRRLNSEIERIAQMRGRGM
jgi:hypothetical protein